MLGLYTAAASRKKKSGALACAQRCGSGARPGRGRSDGCRRGPEAAAKGRGCDAISISLY